MSEVRVFFLDVGQGTSSVLIRESDSPKSGNRAIVIDCGPEGQIEPVKILKDKNVSFIDAIIITHNHEDHYGALPDVVSAYSGDIGRLAYVSDCPPRENPVFAIAKEGFKKKWFRHKPYVVQVDDEPCEPRWLEDEWGDHVKLYFLSPGGFDAQMANWRGTANDASAVVLLKVGAKNIVFSGDATLRTWEAIHKLVNRTLTCAVAVVPHHGGKLWQATCSEDKLRWLFGDVLKPKWAIVSVGSDNDHGHPRKEVIQAIIAASEARVLCTEMTTNCFGIGMDAMPEAERQAWGGVICAGTIEACLSRGQEIQRPRWNEHLKFIEDLASKLGKRPLCRPN